MSDLTRLIAEADELFAAGDSLREKLKENNVAVHEKLELIDAAVEAGARTGDRLLDLVLRSAGYSPQVLARYTAIEAVLKKYQGQHVLLQFETRMKFPSFFWRTIYPEYVHVARVGKIKSTHLSTPNGLLTFPVDRFALMVHRFECGKIEGCKLVEQNLFVRNPAENQPSTFGYLALFKDIDNFLILGDEAVDAWLATRPFACRLEQAKAVLEVKASRAA